MLCVDEKSWINNEIELSVDDCFAGVTAQCCSLVKALQTSRAEQ